MIARDTDWGYEVLFSETELYVAKLLFMKEFGVIDWHYHEDKEQTLCVTDGVVRICTTEKCDIFLSGRGVNIPRNLLHSIEAIGDSTIVELSIKVEPKVVRSQHPELVGAR